MSDQYLEFVSQIGTATNTAEAGEVFLRAAHRSGANLLHAFMGTSEESFRVTNLPEWAVSRDCNRPKLLSSHTVKAVRGGKPRVIWGADIDKDNPNATPVGLQMGQERWHHFGQRCGVTFSMPDPDGAYRGAGVGFGFEDARGSFYKMLAEKGGNLALLSFAAHTRLQFLLENERPPSPLSPRQAEILCYLSQGNKLAAIAYKLGISDATVNMHLSKLKQKLNVKTKEQALAIALVNKWIVP